MARSEARIFTRIWSDEHFTARTPLGQWLYFYLLSQPALTVCGVIDYHPARWIRFVAGVTKPKMQQAVAELQAAHFILVDEHTDEVWVRTLIKNDVARGGPKLLVAISRTWAGIVSDPIRQGVLDAVHDHCTAMKDDEVEAMLDRSFQEAYRKRYPKGHTHTPSGAPPNTPLDGVEEGASDTPPDGVLAGACPGAHALAPAPAPAPSSSSAREAPPATCDQPDNEDDDDRLDQTWNLLAQADLTKRTNDGLPPPHRPTSWLATAARNRRTEHHDQAVEFLADHPEWGPDQLAAALQPAADRAIAGPPSIEESDAWRAQQAALADQSRAERDAGFRPPTAAELLGRTEP